MARFTAGSEPGLCMAVLILIASTQCCFGSSMSVDGFATGLFYNPVSHVWADQPITLTVNDDGSVKVATGDYWVGCSVQLSIEELRRVEACLTKATVWATKAKTAELDTEKDFDCEIVTLSLKFISKGQGQRFYVLLHTENDIRGLDLYLNAGQLATLMTLFDKIPQTEAKLGENDRRSEILN